MNRMEEYEALMAELEQPVPGLEGTLERAENRARRKRLWTRPLAGLAACFAIFVLLVNFSAPVAYACSQVPVLRELAAAVTFSRSLSDAVENEYVQPISLTQTDNGVTVTVEYLIVDQKQVNVFFRVESGEDTDLSVTPRVLMPDMTAASCSCHLTYPETALQCLTIDFVDEDVPESLRLLLKVGDGEVFDFLLEFDPEFTAAGNIYPVDQTVVLDGQKITITDVEVYPTHLRVNIQDDPENTAWLRSLDFYIETDWGMRFETSSGISATGTTDTPTMNSYRADSTYFYEAEHLKVVITGAEWLRKDMDKIYVNLETGETGELPEGVWLHSAVRDGNDWVLEFASEFREDAVMHQFFRSSYYDAQGNGYEFNTWSTMLGMTDGEIDDSFFVERFSLVGYPYEEVWLSPSFSHVWVAEDVIIITVE